jgi:uracil phosphoribosyltransferase
MALEATEDATVVTHALAREALTTLRDIETGSTTFRTELERLGRICGETICDDYFETESVAIRTPLTETEGVRVAGRENVVLVNVLRAATPMVQGMLDAFPAASQGVISASRDEEAGRKPDGTFAIEVQYVKLPEIEPEDTVIVADPMLATGSTLTTVLEVLRDAGAAPEQLFVCAAVAAPEGIERVREAEPDAEVVTVAVDDHLDDDGFIVPGLGDAGDRAFNTKEL